MTGAQCVREGLKRSGRPPSIWGIAMSLRKERTKAVKGILSGRDVFVCLPTGYGKTLCCSILPHGGNFHLKELGGPKAVPMLVTLCWGLQ